MAVYTNAGGGGGASSDELTAARGDVLKGKTAVTSDSSDEPVEGTLELTGDAADSDVYKRQGQELLMGAISLVSILAETGVAALSALGQGAMFVADNLDFILPVLAAVALGLAVLHRQAILAGIASVGSALA